MDTDTGSHRPGQHAGASARRRRVRRALISATILLGSSTAAITATATTASAQPNRWCDYVAERGIVGADSMVHYWWAVGKASGCWD